mgnify:CR=1 FL=1
MSRRSPVWLVLLWFAWMSSACDDDATRGRPDAAVDADPDATSDADSDADADGGELPDCAARLTEDVLIPVGDGASLAATVVRPVDPACRVPVVLVQTPYGRGNFLSEFLENPFTEHPLFHSPDYGVVVLDWRGFFGSSGAPPASLQRGYGEDGHDVVAWIADQPWSDGNVGTWGVSALCRVQYQTAVKRPAALKAAVPIFCQQNYTYLETYPGGVVRREYLQFLGSYFGAGVWEAHPTRDTWWTWAERLYPVADVAVPVLVVAGWFDLYNTGGIESWQALRQLGDPAARAEHRLLAGPWHHFASGGESTGLRPLTEEELAWMDETREIERWSLRFFDRHLRGMTARGWDEAVVFRPAGEEAWETATEWPPGGTEEMTWTLSADGALVEGAGTSGDVTLAVSPFDPSPTVGGQTLLSTYAHGPTWQDEVVAREDATVFVTSPLAAPLRLIGAARVELTASVPAVDGDVAVRLTDVTPDGRHLLITDGIARLSLPSPYAVRTLVTPGQAVPVTVELTNQIAWTLPAGHRLGLIVSGANYARFDVNPHDGAAFFTGTGLPAELTLHLNSEAVLRVQRSP